jgi:hypothetical protein
MRVLVCGGRDWTDEDTLYRILGKLTTVLVVDLIIEGEARGADTMAREWARSAGYPVAPYPADWRTYGRRAGAIRNRRMLEEGRPDLVVAFPTPGSVGTHNMTRVARAAGIPVWIMPGEEARIDALGEGVFA